MGFYIVILLVRYIIFKVCIVGNCLFSWNFFGPYMNQNLVTENYFELNCDSPIFVGAHAGISETKIC